MEPVGITGMFTWAVSDSFMTEPCPYLRSMVLRAVARASRRISSGVRAGFFAMGVSGVG